MANTNEQYDAAVSQSSDIFIRKAKDYGTSWRILRPISVMDQIFIKASRIRNLQDLNAQKIDDDISSEFKGILNYAVIGLMQLQLGEPMVEDLQVEKVKKLYSEQVAFAKKIMLDKNHDYGEAWREMSQQSFADLILMKLMRIKQILANDGKTLVSEGIDANYVDIINYAVFALILINEGKH